MVQYISRMAKTLAVLVLALASVASEIPPVEKCKLSDDACAKASAQKYVPAFVSGIPELGVEVLDPLNMDDVKFDLAGLKFTLNGGQLKGLKTATMDKASIDMAAKEIIIKYHLDAFLKGHYTAAGRLLILPITGDGEMKLNLKNLHMNVRFPFNVAKGPDGKDRLEVKSYKFDFVIKDNAHFALSNLFNGNKELSEAMLNFLNGNWQLVAQEFGKPLVEACVKVLYRNIKKFMMKVPLEELTLQ